MTKIRLEPITIKGDLFDTDELQRIISNTMTAEAKNIKVDFDVTTQTWNRRPKFVIRGTKFARQIKTDSKIYGYVNDGTRPHVIVPRSAKMLSFRTGYKAKTIVRQIASRAGGASGGRAVAKVVNHPGTKARKFDEAIKEKWDKLFPQILQRAIDSEL